MLVLSRSAKSALHSIKFLHNENYAASADGHLEAAADALLAFKTAAETQRGTLAIQALQATEAFRDAAGASHVLHQDDAAALLIDGTHQATLTCDAAGLALVAEVAERGTACAPLATSAGSLGAYTRWQMSDRALRMQPESADISGDVAPAPVRMQRYSVVGLDGLLVHVERVEVASTLPEAAERRRLALAADELTRVGLTAVELVD
jgi:hypothetical protein